MARGRHRAERYFYLLSRRGSDYFRRRELSFNGPER